MRVPTTRGGHAAAKMLDFHNSTSTFRGGRVNPAYDKEGCDYLVWSYKALIAAHHPTTGWWIKPNLWTQTTSAHLGYVRRAVGEYQEWTQTDKPTREN